MSIGLISGDMDIFICNGSLYSENTTAMDLHTSALLAGGLSLFSSYCCLQLFLPLNLPHSHGLLLSQARGSFCKDLQYAKDPRQKDKATLNVFELINSVRSNRPEGESDLCATEKNLPDANVKKLV